MDLGKKIGRLVGIVAIFVIFLPPIPAFAQGALTCTGIAKDVAVPQYGDKVITTCSTDYTTGTPYGDFRWSFDDGGWWVFPGATYPVDSITHNATLTFNSIDQYAVWKVECRICTDSTKTTCTTWGQVTPSCDLSFTIVHPTSAPQTNSSSTNTSFHSTTDAPVCGDTKPAATPDLFQIDTTNTSANLFFTPLMDTSTYYVSYSTQPNAEEHGGQITLDGKGGVLHYSVQSLKSDTTYYMKVRGQNGCMPGNWSNVMKITTNKKGAATASSYYKNISSKAKIPVTGTSLPLIFSVGIGLLFIFGTFFSDLIITPRRK
jgi:hypothetical protein